MTAARRPGLSAVRVVALVLTLAMVALRGAGAQSIVTPDLRAEAARLFGELAQLRGIPAPGSPPRLVVRTREERRRFIAGELARKYAPARLEAERRSMVAWGLVPADFELTGFLTDLVLEQAAAYYDPVGKVMVLANWLGPGERREALTHELVHALQDRQMDLDGFLTGPAGKSDDALARQALVEGEAVAVSMDLALQRQGPDLASLPDVVSFQRAILTSATGPLLSRAPRFLRSMLTFPYAQGLGFVHQFRRRFPWRQLSTLYQDPPRSTTQILHPERYFDRREDPLRVRLPDLGPALGSAARLVFEDEAGEFGLTEILTQFLGADTGALGWRGDRYAIWDDRGTTVLVAMTQWATEAAAQAFAGAYARVVPRKYGAVTPAAPGPDAGFRSWVAGGRAAAVEQRGRSVLIVEEAPVAALPTLSGLAWAESPAPDPAGSRPESRPRSLVH